MSQSDVLEFLKTQDRPISVKSMAQLTGWSLPALYRAVSKLVKYHEVKMADQQGKRRYYV